ncbi:MAG: hypothetical protein ACI317_01515 [Floccifex porci]|uniref:hypothetical protein n=1 Tax=Floccifex porci TaxID=2606629 RepID=UPI003F085A41
MREKKTYKRPEVRFSRVALDKAVANECWKWGTTQEDNVADHIYYNYSGKGYVSFSIDGPPGANNCKGGTGFTAQIRNYIDINENEKEAINAEFESWWAKESSKPNGGSSYNGTAYLESDPGTSWS